MENASKALLIAGAILLAILLISLGIMIFNTASDTITSSGMSDMQQTTFNQKFEKYQGKQKGSAIRSLVQEVMANNNNAQASDETMVSINVANGSIAMESSAGIPGSPVVKLEAGTDKQPVYNNFSNTTTYNVSFKHNKGRVAIIYIK